jgi:hypothetical protein
MQVRNEGMRKPRCDNLNFEYNCDQIYLQLDYNRKIFFKSIQSRAGKLAQAIKHLPSKNEVLNPNPVLKKNKK